MRFAPYDRLDGRPNVVVDGSPTDGTAVTLTHWPGYPPPPEVAADLSAQIAFRWLEHPELHPAGVELVSNNHFDQDGLVSAFALTEPDAAFARRAVLEGLAAAGDFATYRHRDAARASMVVSSWSAELASPYEEALPRLAELCDHVERWRDVWEEEDAVLAASEAAFERGDATVVEHPDVELAVVTVGEGAPTGGGHRFGGERVSGLHPMAVHGATDRLVVATIRGRRYEVRHRYESWVQLVSRPLRLRRDLVPLAERLNDEEAGGTWTATPVGGLIPVLTVGGESSIAPARFTDLVVAHLRDAPPAWDPFAVTTTSASP